jgi:tRNA threonylcarbamoyladenosine biosynthesis protein TsaB
MILAIKSDEPEVYLGLFKDEKEQIAKNWSPGRELSVEILEVIDYLCKKTETAVTEIDGIIVYQGPGSYTGLRIGVSVANTMGYSNNIPVVGVTGKEWIDKGFYEIKKIDKFSSVSPLYGGEVYTTKPKK